MALLAINHLLENFVVLSESFKYRIGSFESGSEPMNPFSNGNAKGSIEEDGQVNLVHLGTWGINYIPLF